MVESQADRLPEDVMLGAVMFGHQQMQVAIEAIRSLAKEAGRPPIVWTAPVEDKALASGIAKFIPAITDAYGIAEKQVRYAKIARAQEAVRRRAHGSRGQHLDAGANRGRVP